MREPLTGWRPLLSNLLECGSDWLTVVEVLVSGVVVLVVISGGLVEDLILMWMVGCCWPRRSFLYALTLLVSSTPLVLLCAASSHLRAFC